MADRNPLKQIQELESEKRNLQLKLKANEKSSFEQAERLEQTLQELEIRARELLLSQAAYGEQKNILESILNSMAEGVVVANCEGRFLLFNSAAEQMTGFGLMEGDSREWSERYGCYLPDGKTLYPHENLPLMRAMRGESVNESEMFIRNANKPQGIWLSINARPLRDARGLIQGGVVVLRDITDRKRAEASERESANYLDKIINSVADPIFVKDREHRWVLLNDACCKFIGHPREVLIGNSDYDFFPKEEADIFRAKDELVFTTGIGNLNEEDFTDAGGVTHTIVTKKTRYTDSRGQHFIVGIIRDFTEQKKTERRLALQYDVTKTLSESESLIEAVPRLMQSLGENLGWDLAAFWLFEPEEESLRCLEFWNSPLFHCPGFKDISGRIRLPKGIDLPGRAWEHGQAVWMTEMTRDIHSPRVRIAAAEGFHAGAAFPVRVEDKIWGVMEFFSRKMLLQEEETMKLFNAIGSQIGQFVERRQTAKNLYQKNLELSRSNAEREQLEMFAQIASHDLQEPLQKVIAFGGLLKTQASSWMDEKSKSYVEKMQLAASRMGKMIDDLFQFSRVTMQDIVFETVDLEIVIGEVLSDLDHSLSRAGAEVELGPLPAILADRRQIRILFQNLISNALKFRKEDVRPRIIIQSRLIGTEHLKLSISDNGVGFDGRYAEKIFKPFERAHGRKYEGSGMGLAICKKIVMTHHGEISAESQEGHGAVFTIILPVNPGEGGPLK